MTETGFRLQETVEKAIAALAELKLDRPIGLVAEYPAHLPAVEGDESAIVQTLARIIQIVMLNTNQDEVRIRVQTIPPSSEIPDALQTQGFNAQIPQALISVFDQDSLPGKGSAADQTEKMHRNVEAALETLHGDLIAGPKGIWLDQSSPGIRVWLAVPLSAAESPPQELERMKRIIQTRIPDSAQSGQLLLIHVEDQSTREMLSTELMEQGYRVLSSRQPGEILSLARANMPDLIILDLQARSPTAFDVAMLLKQDRHTQLIPILFLTAIQDQAGSVRMEMANFLVRPEGTGAILATVEAVLSSGLHPTSRIMVVEGDDVLRENIILHLQARGYPVLEASSPEESVALAERVHVRVALVNARLAHERDYWLLRQLRGASEDLEIYVIAEALSEEEGQAAMIRGASGYGETRQLPELLDRVEGDKELS